MDVRRLLREASQYDLADHVRDALQARGISLEDRRDGTTWRPAEPEFQAALPPPGDAPADEARSKEADTLRF